MPIEPWRATCIQISSDVACDAGSRDEAWSIIEGNVARAEKAIRDVCTGPNPPRLVVMPEFAFQGPPRATPVSTWIERACTTIPGPITERFAALAREFGIFIGGNHFEVDPHWPDRCFNSCFLLDPSGDVILRYRRINTASWTSPHDILDEYLEAYGQEGLYPVADTELGKLAILPCGEISVPELSRMFMMRGAEVIVHPTNEPVSGTNEAAKVCRAAENMVYLVSANVAGPIGFSADGSVLGGHSQIVDYRGQVLAIDKGTGDSTSVSAMVDIEALRTARRDTGMANALLRTRWEMYKPQFGAAQIYPANGLVQTPLETGSEAGPVVQRAMENLTRAGIVVPG